MGKGQKQGMRQGGCLSDEAYEGTGTVNGHARQGEGVK